MKKLDDSSEDDVGWRRVDEVHVSGPVAVIGDIHGRSDLSARLLVELRDMPVFILGDVGDRGPDTSGVTELLVQREARGVRGNHEDWQSTGVEAAAGVAVAPPSDDLLATARLILARRQRAETPAPPARLWPVVMADVRALSLETAQEASLAIACYALLFGRSQEW